MIELNLASDNQGLISTDVNTLADIRAFFSMANPAYKRSNKFAPARLYAISPAGKFDIGLTDNIISFLEINQYCYEVDDKLDKKINIGFKFDKLESFDKFVFRDHQEKSITAALQKGRGVVVIPTAGGKTLIMASIIKNLRKLKGNDNLKALVLVPSIQLVEQTSSDFINYGLTDVTKWSGGNIPDDNALITIASNQILLSEKTDLTKIMDYDMLLVDETHTLRRGNEINKILKIVKTDHKFGFTGTMPSTNIDQWNIIGKIGPIVFEEKTFNLKQKNFVSDFQIVVLKIIHDNVPSFKSDQINPANLYNLELEYLLKNKRRNEIIANLSKKLSNNTIIMVDRIEHGENIEKELRATCDKNRPIYFIQGSTEMTEREEIRSLMEKRNDIIVVAVSKIFSTGINIPNLHNIIFASAGKAKIKIMQSIGRALRLHPTKTMANIFDISDNTRYGKIHLSQRIKLYDNEKYKYQIKTI